MGGWIRLTYLVLWGISCCNDRHDNFVILMRCDKGDTPSLHAFTSCKSSSIFLLASLDRYMTGFPASAPPTPSVFIKSHRNVKAGPDILIFLFFTYGSTVLKEGNRCYRNDSLL